MMSRRKQRQPGEKDGDEKFRTEKDKRATRSKVPKVRSFKFEIEIAMNASLVLNYAIGILPGTLNLGFEATLS